ncbi:hypothetical protein Tco_0369211 [Tanacetum coccineum]
MSLSHQPISHLRIAKVACLLAEGWGFGWVLCFVGLHGKGKGWVNNMAPLPPREQRHPFLRYQGLEYTDANIVDFKERLERIYSREIHQVQVVDFQRMPELMRDGLFARMVMEHRDDVGVVVFTSRAWGRLFDTIGPLVWELILEFLSTLRFGEVLLDLDAPDTMQEEMESLSFARMMAHSIAGRIQAPEKVTVTDLFNFRGLDVGSVNIPYLLARYLRRFAVGRKSGAHISVIAPTLPVIDMAELVRLQICMEIDDTWAWVALGPERQLDAAACVPEAAEGVMCVFQALKL